jgi:hypothetical protein
VRPGGHVGSEVAEQTLVLTTTLGVRPLGVRGEPLHSTQTQIRTAIRRRLGDRYAALLAEAQPHADGPGLDWYAEVEGRVRPLRELPAAERADVVAEVYRMLEQIAEVGRELARSGTGDAALTGRSLQLATGRPSDDYIFLIGKQPVIVAWGYEHEALPRPLIPNLPPPPVPVEPPPAPAVLAAAPVAVAATQPWWGRWLYWLLLGLLLLALLLALSWLLRSCAPGGPDVAINRLPGEPPPPELPAPPDPTPEKRVTLVGLQDRDRDLRAELARLEAELTDRRAQCKPPEPPKPPEPQVAVAPPPPPPRPVVRPPEPPRPAPRPEPPPRAEPPPRPEPPRQQAIAPQPRAVPPPGSLPCNVDTASGGQGVTRNRHFLGSQSGPVSIRYDMKTIPDQMNVYYQGQMVASTGQMTSGRGSINFNFQPRGGDNTVMVEIVGPNRGTSWNYVVNCP